MSSNTTKCLASASLLAALLTTFHIADDIVHGIAPGGLTNLNVVVPLVAWLYATLVLVERRSGYVITLVLSLLASGVSVIHMTGKSGITAGITSPSGAFFFAWTILALGVTAMFSVVLSVRGLWSLRRSPGDGE